MNKIKYLLGPSITLVLFTIWTILVKTVDVRYIQDIGFLGFYNLNTSINTFVQGCNTNLFHLITQVLLFISIGVALTLGILGITQLFIRKRLKKVDKMFYILLITYILMAVLYFVFELMKINFSPLSTAEELKASYPSSHIFIFLTIIGSGLLALYYFKPSKLLKIICIAAFALLVPGMSLLRLFSGHHYFTDVIGAILLSLFAVSITHSMTWVLKDKNILMFTKEGWTKISDETNVEKIEGKSRKNMLLGTILGYIAIAISVCYGLFLTPEIVDAVGETDYGLYGLTSSIAVLLLMDFGLTNTIYTYLAKLRANNDKKGVETFMASIFKLYLMLDLIFVVAIAVLFFISPYIFKAYYVNGAPIDPFNFDVSLAINKLRYLILIVGGFTLISVPCSSFTAVMSAYEKFGMIKTADILQKTLYLVFSIVAIQLGWGIIGIVLVNTISGLLAIALRVVYSRFYIGIRLNLKLSVGREDLKAILSFSGWGFVVTLCSRLVITIAPTILGIVSNSAEVTLFSLVVTIEQYIFMVGEMMSSFFMAKIARNDATGSEEEKREKLQNLAEKVGKLQFIIIALIICGFVSCGQEFVLVWMKGKGELYNIYWCIVLICSYEVIHIPQLALQNAMYTRGYIKPYALTQIIKAFVSLALCLTLGSFYGAVGVAFGILGAQVVELIATNIVYKKYLKISLSHYFAAIYIRGGITMVISIGIGMILHFFLHMEYHMVIQFLIIGVVVVVVYTLCTLFITFKKDERHYYSQALMRIVFKKKNQQIEQ